jgi:hypothetical protein
MTRADDPTPPVPPAGSVPFRFDSGTVRLPPVAAPAPAAPPAATSPAVADADAGRAPEVNVDAAIAERMARIRAQHARIGGAPIGMASPTMPRVAAPSSPRRQALIAVLIALVCTVAVLAAYLAFAVPGPWVTRESPRAFVAASLELPRGHGAQRDGELVVSAAGPDNLTIVSVRTDLPADRFRGIGWIATGLPETAVVRVVWQSDIDPARTHTLPAAVEAGRVRPVVVADTPGWIGNIRGLGLVVQGPLVQPLRIRGVVAKPMGAAEVLSDRVHEWLAFEAWSGTSVNVVVGGADVQDLPLPPLVAVVIALAAGVMLALWRWRPRLMPDVAVAIAALFFAGWFVLDARWTFNLARQLPLTWGAYAGKSERDKHLAAADGALYEFVQRARAVLPSAPQRVWVVSDAAFFNGRGAYHLYPHNVHFEPRGRAMPDRAWVKPGDWLLVYNRRGVEFDAQRNVLRWEGGPDLAAELKASGTGAALFLLR